MEHHPATRAGLWAPGGTLCRLPATLASGRSGGLTGEISESCVPNSALTGRVEPATAPCWANQVPVLQGPLSSRALTPPPGGMKPPRIENPQDPNLPPVRPPAHRAPRPVHAWTRDSLSEGHRTKILNPDHPSKALASGLPLFRSTPAYSGGGFPPFVIVPAGGGQNRPLYPPSLEGPSRPTVPRNRPCRRRLRGLVGPCGVGNGGAP